MAIRNVKIMLDQWDIQSELIFEVDDEKLTEQLAAEINNFWSGDIDRLDNSEGSVIDAALKLYAVECFQLVAFNNFYDEEYVTRKFDWSRGEGVEGFPSFSDAGIKLIEIGNWGIDFDFVKISKQ